MSIGTSNAGLEWAEALRGVFPARPIVADTQAANTLLLLGQWWLETDAYRPRKKSKAVEIVFPAGVLELYGILSLDQKRLVWERVAKRLHLRLLLFRPDRKTPWYQRSPSERWTITREDLE